MLEGCFGLYNCVIGYESMSFWMPLFASSVKLIKNVKKPLFEVNSSLKLLLCNGDFDGFGRLRRNLLSLMKTLQHF